MPVVNTTFTNNGGGASKLESVLKDIENAEVDVTFGTTKLDRAYIEMVIEQYSKESQDSSVANKWIQIDTALEKELRRFKVAMSNLLSAVVQTSQAQQAAGQPAQPEVAQPGMTGPIQSTVPQGRKLPEPLV